MSAERTAQVSWSGNLLSGTGKIEFTGSGALAGADMTWASRSEPDEDGRTSPEELIAAAHASCFSMALSHGLAQDGHPPDRLNVKATSTFVPGDRDHGDEARRHRPRAGDERGRVPGGRSHRGGELPGLAGAQGQRRHLRRRPSRPLLTTARLRRLERRWRNAHLLLLLALPLFAGTSLAATRPTLTSPRACADSAGFTCMTLAVPLDHSGHVRGALKLQVAVQDAAPSLGVLVFLTGGPGQPGAPFAGRGLAAARRGLRRLSARPDRPAGHRRARFAVPGAAAADGQLRPRRSDAGRGDRLRGRDRRQAALLRHRPDRSGPRLAAPCARREEADARRSLIRDVRRRALRDPLPEERRRPRARFRRPARRARRTEDRECARGGTGAAPGVPRTPLSRRSRRRPRRRRHAPPGNRHGAARRAGDDERDRADLPGRPGSAARGAPGKPRRARHADRELQARSEYAGRGPQPGAARERALRRQPDAVGRARDSDRTAAARTAPRGREARATRAVAVRPQHRVR